MTIPRLKSYVDCMEKWKSVRSKEKGKPISSAIRMFKNPDGSFELKQWSAYPLATIYPDNTIELKFTGSPPNQMHETVPIYENRVSKGIYRVDHHINVPRGTYGYPDHIHMTKVAPEYFPGIKFNMITGECLNRRLDRSERLDHFMNKNWKRDLGKFRKNLMARAKLGAFDAIVAGYSGNNRRALWVPKMKHDEFLKQFAVSMKGDDYPPEFIEEFVRMMVYRQRHNDNSSAADKAGRAFNSITSSNRTVLKQLYGVYSPPA